MAVDAQPVDRVDELGGGAERQPASRVRDQLGQGAEVADDRRRPLGEGLQDDDAEDLVADGRHDERERPRVQLGQL